MKMWALMPVHYEYDDERYSVSEGHGVPVKIFKNREDAEKALLVKFRQWFRDYTFGDMVQVHYLSDEFFEFIDKLAPIMEIHHEITAPSREIDDDDERYYENKHKWSKYMTALADHLTDEQTRGLIEFLHGHGYAIHPVEVED